MDQSKSNKRSKYESFDDPNQEKQNHFVLPVEIMLIIFFNSYQKECNQKHQWCSCDIINHQYDKNQTIFRLMKVCKSWHNIIGQIVQRKIILNQLFLDFDEQKRSLEFVKLFNSNSFLANNIKEIIIYDNFFFNSVMLNIVNSCLSLEKLILKYNTTRNYFQRQRSKTVSETVITNLGKNFQKDLINHYEKDNIVCKRDRCNEPIYWGGFIYWNYCYKHRTRFLKPFIFNGIPIENLRDQ